MSDTMPERVWVSPLSIMWHPNEDDIPDAVPYVPEQRALDAERERDEARSELAHLTRMIQQRDESFKEAMLPLARWGMRHLYNQKDIYETP